MQLEKKYYIPIQDLMFSKKILCIALESDLLSEDELDVYTAALEEKNMAMEVFICIIKHNKALVSDSFTIDQESSNMGGTVPFVSLYHHVILQSYEDDTENFISFKDIPLFGVDVEDLKAPTVIMRQKYRKRLLQKILIVQ